MDHNILNSVIKITNQRDVDSLEYSLVATLAEMIPVTDISVYKMVDDGYQTQLEQTLHLAMQLDPKTGEKDVLWSQGPIVVHKDPDILNCFNTALKVNFDQGQSSLRLILPIVCDNKVVAALDIKSNSDLSRYIKTLEAMMRIYENYLFILNESERDKLTGLFNRRTFDKKLDRLLQFQRNKQLHLVESKIDSEKRSLKPYSEAWLAIVDVDHFKMVNDKFGHVFGDGVLLLLSHKMKQCFRQTDYLFRFGGEEFVVILEPHPQEQAFETLNRFRQAISSHTFPLVGKVTVSIGYARISESDYPPAILHSADKALYYAKDNGRNCIYNYETLVDDGAIEATPLGASIGI